MFSISALELVLVIVLAASALAAYLRRLAVTRWMVAAAVCFALASLLTPADIASTLLIGTVFLACFAVGTIQRSPRPSPSA